MPERIQRKRTKGWRMPDGAVYVGRPTVWGNIWRPEDAPVFFGSSTVWTPVEKAAWVVRQYEMDARNRQFIHYDLSEADEIPLADVPALLGGKDLVCWCPLVDQHGNYMPCHADVLLKLANPEPTIHELIERSSLGTPEAKRIRESADPAAVERVMARARQFSAEEAGRG